MLYDNLEIEKSNGFNVGLIGDLRINDFFNLRFEPGLYANQRKLIYPDQDGLNSENDKIREIKSTYIHLPLLIKFVFLFIPYTVSFLPNKFQYNLLVSVNSFQISNHSLT